MTRRPGFPHLLSWVLASLSGAALIFAVPLTLYLNGVSPSAHWEESVGYRYFYSLRIAYGNELPWLPQGQLASLVHIGIQYLLTYWGSSPHSLFPRVDDFSAAAVLIPALLTFAGFLWLGFQFRSSVFLAALVSATVVATLAARLPDGWTTMPDYHVWVIPLALASIALGREALQDRKLTVPGCLWLGLLTGFAITLKPTFAVFPLAVIGLHFSSFMANARLGWQEWGRFAAAGLLLCLTSLLSAALILAAYYRFDVGAFFLHFKLLADFSRNQSSTLGQSGQQSFLSIFLPQSWDDPGFLIAPILLSTILAGLFRRTTILLGLLPAQMLSIFFTAARFYSHTLIETHAFFLVAAVLLLSHSRLPVASLKAASVAFVTLCCLIIAFPAQTRLRSIAARAETASNAAAGILAEIARAGGTTAILTTENTYRPVSILSALCKGGTNIFNPVWGASPYIAALFPEFRCGFLKNSHTAWQFDNVHFLRIEPMDQAIRRVEAHFENALGDRTCDVEVPAPSAHLVLCRPSNSGPSTPRLPLWNASPRR